MATQIPDHPDLDRLAAMTADVTPESTRREGAEPYRVLLSILAEGRPASIDELAEATGRSTDEVSTLLPPDGLGLEWDTEGRLVGVGMTLNPTPHRVEVDGNVVYAWCAADTLGMLPAVGRTVKISSPCPVTGRTVSVTAHPHGVEDVQPPEAVVSVVPTGTAAEPRGTMCNFGHFFTSTDAASGWRDQHPHGLVLSVPDAFRYALGVMRRLLDE